MIPIEIIWEIFFNFELKTLPSMFCVCRLWSNLSRNGNFWREFWSRRIHIPPVLFPINQNKPITIEFEVIKMIDANDLESIEKIPNDKLKKALEIEFTAEWMFGTNRLNFLHYAILKDKEDIVNYFITNDIFKTKQEDIEMEEVNIWSLCVFFRKRYFLQLFFDLGLKPVYSTKLLSYQFFKSLLRRTDEVTHVTAKGQFICPLLSLIVLLDDFKTLKLFLRRIPQSQIFRNCKELSIVNCIHFSMINQREDFIRMILERNGFFKKVSGGGYDIIQEENLKISELIIDEIRSANERYDQMIIKKGSGEFKVFFKRVTPSVNWKRFSTSVKLNFLKDTVEKMEKKFLEKEEIKDWNINVFFIFQGKRLEKTRYITQYGIEPYSTVFVMIP